MKPTIDLYCGSPIELESEKIFLEKLSAGFAARGFPALIFANFFPPCNPHQIDFLVITGRCACHVELKRLTAPVIGGINGPWTLQMPDGSLTPLQAKNPYRQAMDGKLAISDEMHRFVATNPSIPRPMPAGSKFYKHLESVVCVFPELLPGSSVYQDFKVRVHGYEGLLTLLTTRENQPGWTREHWIAFAMHLGLVHEESVDDALSLEVRTASDAVTGYAHRFLDFYGRDLPSLVPTTIRGDAEVAASVSLLEALLERRHLQLVGPSGCGKSLLAKHMALGATSKGQLPILVSARDYEGKLSTLLDRGVAHLHPDTALNFLQAARRTGSQICVILDGFNECPPKRQKDLLKDLQAFFLRWSAPILITSQNLVEVPEALAGAVWQFSPLSMEEKTAVLHTYADKAPSQDVEAVTEPFQTPYELSLVAECLAELDAPVSRADVFDAYVRRCCKRTNHPDFCRAMCTAIADRMRRRLVGSLPLAQLWRIAAEITVGEGGRTSNLTEALTCGLLQVRQGRCCFRHELLERFFQAEALVHAHRNDGSLGRELTRPRNRGLAEFVLGAEPDTHVMRGCLETIADGGLLADCVRGRYGTIAKEVANEDCGKVLRKAQRSLEDVDVELKEEGQSDWKPLVVTGGPEWSPYDWALMGAVGNVLRDGLFVDEVFRLFGGTEERCRSILTEKAGTPYLPPVEVAHLYAALYGYIFARSSFPASAIYHASRSRFRNGEASAVEPALVRLLGSSLESRLPGELLLFCQLLPYAGPALRPALARLLRECWKTGIYHLRLEALWMAQRNAHDLEGPVREEVKEFLGTLTSRNLFLNSAIIEALTAYDMVDPPVSPEDVSQELATILASPADLAAQEQAYYLVANSFEDVYQGAFWEVIEALTTDDRVMLLTMAALGAPDYAAWLDWCLKELVNLQDSRALPAFVRRAMSIDINCVCPQDTVASYLWSIKGCTLFLQEPPGMSHLENDVQRAWEMYGSIFFWLYKPGLTLEQKRAACVASWSRLH